MFLGTKRVRTSYRKPILLKNHTKTRQSVHKMTRNPALPVMVYSSRVMVCVADLGKMDVGDFTVPAFALVASAVLLAGAAAFLRWLLAPCAPSVSLPPPPTEEILRNAAAAETEARTTRLRTAPKTGLRYLVVGTGSLGSCIAQALLERGEREVAGFDTAPNAQLERAGVRMVRGSVTELKALSAACAGVDVVYATFALIRFYERLPFQYAESHAVNVAGTANLLAACVSNGVRVLVATSTSHVCVSPQWCTAKEPARLDEHSPLLCAERSPSHYGWTKVQAERLVLEAHSHAEGGLRAGCVRPCSAIFGPADGFITQKWLAKGGVELLIPEPVIDYVFVESVAYGHLLLERALLNTPEAAGGQAYCISADEPLTGGDFFAKVGSFYTALTTYRFTVTRLPPRLLYAVSHLVEAVQWLTGNALKGEVATLTPAMFHTARCAYTFSSARARSQLGYQPLYSLDAAVHRTVALWHEGWRAKLEENFRKRTGSDLANLYM